MDYNGFLELDKQQYPYMLAKEQQKLASQKNKEFKANLKEQQNNAPSDKMEKGAPLEIKDDLTYEMMVQAEKRIRTKGMDVNSIISIGREVIPAGELVRHGKDGVNTRVSWEDKEGNKLPINGHFFIYI